MNRAVWLLVLVSLSGCASMVSSSHHTGLVEELGLDEAQRELVRVSRLATSPQVTDVQLHDGWFSLRGAFNFYQKLDVYYENVARLELYSSGAVFLRGADRVLGKLHFDSVATGTRWCNLVASLKAYHHERVALPPGDDGLEENNTRWNAAPLDFGSYEGLRLWDLDWYAIDVAQGDTLTVEARFEPVAHDLELALFDDAGKQLALTEASRGLATLRYDAAQHGTVYVRVSSTQGGATYTLELRY